MANVATALGEPRDVVDGRLENGAPAPLAQEAIGGLFTVVAPNTLEGPGSRSGVTETPTKRCGRLRFL